MTTSNKNAELQSAVLKMILAAVLFIAGLIFNSLENLL